MSGFGKRLALLGRKKKRFLKDRRIAERKRKYKIKLILIFPVSSQNQVIFKSDKNRLLAELCTS